MNERDLESISQFVATTKAADLFDYFQIARDADESTVEAAVRSKRSWAQGQQSNPKHRSKAIWLIKNVSLCKRALFAERSEYISSLSAAEQDEALKTLGLVMDGAVFNGKLTVEREDAILDRGVQLGLSDEVVEKFIEDYLDRNSVRRSDPTDFVDIYELLGTPKDSLPVDIDRAVARTLAKARGIGPSATSRRRSIRWAARLLRDPDRRRDYDRHWDIEAGGELGGSDGLGDALLLRPAEDPEPTEVMGGLSLKGSSPPPPPSQLGGKTLPVGGATGPVRSPRHGVRLAIEGDAQRTVRVGRAPVSIDIVVRNAGDGRMHGRVVSDRPWMSVSTERLNPDLREQTITVTVDPAGLTRNRAVALCTIIADRGGRKSVTITAEKGGLRPSMVAAGAGVLLLVGLGVSWPWLSPVLFPPPPPPPPSGTMSVLVDPPAGEIHVNGEFISSGGEARGITDLPLDQPVNVRVVLDGFQTWEKSIELTEGEVIEVRPEMVLTDSMDYDPEAEHHQGKLDERAVSTAIRGKASAIGACVMEHDVGEPRADRTIELLVHVMAEGHVGNVAYNGDNVPSPGAQHCIKRHLRALRVPIFEGHYDIARESFVVSMPSTEPPPQ